MKRPKMVSVQIKRVMLLYQRQTNAGTFLIIIHLIKAFKNTGKFLYRNPYAIITYRKSVNSFLFPQG